MAFSQSSFTDLAFTTAPSGATPAIMIWETTLRFLQPLAKLRLIEREDFLIRQASGTIALHVGCVDSGLLRERIASGTHLHMRLAAVAAELWGLDTDETGIQELKRHGFENLISGSAEAPPPDLPVQYFEVIIAGEVIEHVRNVGMFLDSLARLLRPNGILLLTTPNALRFYNPIAALLGRELVHPDHLQWFSPHTLRCAIERGPFVVEEMCAYKKAPRVRLSRSSGRLARTGRSVLNGSLVLSHSALIALSRHWADGLAVRARRIERVSQPGL